MTWEALIALVTLLAAALAGLWKISAQATKVQGSVERVSVDLKTNTDTTKEISTDIKQLSIRVAKLEGVEEYKAKYGSAGRYPAPPRDRDR